MKKKLFILLLLIQFLIPTSKAQKIRTLFYDDILFGKVKMVCQNNYLPGLSIIEVHDTTWYDESGKTTESHRKTMRGIKFSEKYIYTSIASIKKMQVIGNETDQNLDATFDLKGNLSEYSSHFKNGNLNFKSTYEYDNKNNLITYYAYNKDNLLQQKRTYEYSKDGILTKEYLWNEDGKINYEIDFEYSGFDGQGNWLKRIGHRKYPSGKPVPDLIVTREITYY